MDPTLSVALLALAGTVVTAVMMYRASTKATSVNEQADRLEWVKELRADAGGARREVTELRVEVGDLRRQLDVVTREAEQMVAEMRLWRRTAWRDGMTIERYRQFIGPEPTGVNGRVI